MTESSTTRVRERGHTLVVITVLGTLAMAVWTLAFRATHDAIRAERFYVQRDQRDETVTRALASGVDLLRTGPPPDDPYACIVTVSYRDDAVACTVTYTSAGGSNTWHVECGRSTEEEERILPPAPDSFEDPRGDDDDDDDDGGDDGGGDDENEKDEKKDKKRDKKKSDDDGEKEKDEKQDKKKVRRRR